ncbi:SusD/RagB family nutrient-binding outer membrane lipoprotein [Hymenobacter psychrophilus]|uniref:Starch-binding associating with outer membrane n=1 Tax=Hymenobacter psychrophilus TaxID=651662 RepID=A0A1H3H160_9BACT|nr:SusD/RagB family nutrient-binding outer membrane lipoprotein [Hymenobacter psychrophilus]SDY09060.1 Starch-binding associating with outer membrane [Hymenobacter psychrophilus]
MRFPPFTKYAAFALSLGLLGSCDNFLDINQSPNAVLAAPAANVLVAAQSHLGFLMGSDIHRFSSLFVQQFSGQGGSGVQTAEYDRYNVTATDLNNAWRAGIYGGALADMQKLIEQTQTTSPKYAGISKIMQAYLFSVTTDAFGDIPYTDALKFAGNVQPGYDPSQQIYANLITLIDAGVKDLDGESVDKPGADDLVYGGDLAKWRRLANTLKLRLYIHYYPNKSGEINSQLAALVAQAVQTPGNFITTNADNFQVAFESAANRQNPIDQFERQRPNTFFPSSTLVTLMNQKADPRRPFYFTPSPAPAPPAPDQYTGAGNGTGVAGPPNTAFSRMHVYLRGPLAPGSTTNYTGSAPIRMLTAAEHFLILAEYYTRTGNLAAARTNYESGVRASMTNAGVAPASITTYLAAVPAFTAGTALRQIIEEKFVANYGVAVEPWTDWRRTGFPQLAPAANDVTNGVIPRILPYSDLERVANPGNTPVRANLTTPSVFWDPGK